MGDYVRELRAVVEANTSSVEADLETARVTLRRAHHDVATLERQVSLLEGLLALTSESRPTAPTEVRLTLHDAMATVLGEAPSHRLRPAELAAEINRRRLYRMRDGRPVETQQIHARVGHYPQLLRRDGPYIALAE